MTPPRPTASAAELRERFTERWIGGRPNPGGLMNAEFDALIAAVRAETQRETYAMAARIADFEGAHGVSNRIRALVSK